MAVDTKSLEVAGIGPDDIAWCRTAAENGAHPPGDERGRRKSVLDEMSRRIGADHWLWAYSMVDPDECIPTSLDGEAAGNLSLREQLAYIRRVYAVDGMPPENPLIHASALDGKPFATSNRILVNSPADYWSEGKPGGRWIAASGCTDVLYAMVPIRQSGSRWLMSGVTLFRRIGKPPFGQSELAIAGWIMENVAECRAEGRNERMTARMCLLTGATRVVLAFLLGGRRISEIAFAEDRSIETVRVQAKAAAKRISGSWSIRETIRKLGF